MKNIYLRFTLVFFLALFSCQEESSIVTDQDNSATSEDNIDNVISQLLSNMASNDGSIDNILDSASCIEIILPVTVIVNDIELTINTHEDLEIIEAIFDQFPNDEDFIEFVFPVGIIFPDYSEAIINDLDELLFHTSTCSIENESDEDIECLDLIYPISLSVFNAENVILETIVINNDNELIDFLINLDPDLIVSIIFPIEIILWDGTNVTINSQDDLEIALEIAQNACDEDDDNNFDEDDNTDIEQAVLEILLTDCPFELQTIFIENIDVSNQFEGYYLDFNENNTVSANSNGNAQLGSWSLIPQNNSYILDINFSSIPELTKEWQVHSISNDGLIQIELRLITDLLIIKENCSITDNDPGNNFTVDDLNEALETCEWVLDLNGQGEYFFYDFNFFNNGQLQIQNLLNGQLLSGNWESYTNAQGFIVMDLSNLSGLLSPLNDQWVINDFELEEISLNNSNGDILYMNQTCPNNLDLGEVLLSQSWKISYYESEGQNQTSLFNSFVFDFNINNELIAIENGLQGYLGVWESLSNSEAMSIDFALIDDLENLNSAYWIVLDLQFDRVELVLADGSNIKVVVFSTN